MCYVNCTHCDDGELWYSSELENEYTAPTKTAAIEIRVVNGTLDYHKGINGVVKHTRTVTFTADEPININATMNAGEDIGNKTVRARINWDNRKSESNSGNNETTRQIEVIPATDLTLDFVEPNAYYRTNTEIVSSYIVYNMDNIGALNIRPKHNLTADFKAINPNTGEIIDSGKMQSIVIPKKGTNLIYFKWKLPKDYSAEQIKLVCELNNSRSVYEMNYSNNTSTRIIDITKGLIAETPDTVFENRPPSFIMPSSSKYTPTLKLASNIIVSGSYERWEWNGDYLKKKYTISLEADYSMEPDEKSPSRKQLGDAEWMMRSGYGVMIEIAPSISHNLPTNAITDIQRGNVYYPEFDYQYGKTTHSSLDRTENGFELKKSPYTITIKGEQDFLRVHFTPLWFPDGEYRVKTYIFDLWSPIGMLSKMGDIATVTIEGDMYDDWYISHSKKTEE